MIENSIPEIPNSVELLDLDDKLSTMGIPATQRPEQAAKLFYEKTGHSSLAWLTAEKWFKRKYQNLYPSVDFSPQPFMTMCGSARGVSYFLKPPVVLGSPLADPIKCIQIHEKEIKRIWDRSPDEFHELVFQAADGADIWMSRLNFSSKLHETNSRLELGLNLLAAYARQLVACENDSSLPQGMALACELVGKAIAFDLSGGKIDAKSKFGHRLPKIVDYIVNEKPGPINATLIKVSNSIPIYEKVRYDPPAQTFLDAQDVYRRAMFVCADILRRTNHDQLYWKMESDPSIPDRAI